MRGRQACDTIEADLSIYLLLGGRSHGCVRTCLPIYRNYTYVFFDTYWMLVIYFVYSMVRRSAAPILFIRGTLGVLPFFDVLGSWEAKHGGHSQCHEL